MYEKILSKMPKETLLQLKNASAHYGGVKALDSVDVV